MVDRVPGRGRGQTLFSSSGTSEDSSQPQELEIAKEKAGGGSLQYGSLARKCQFSGHVEISFSVNCELNQDIPVSRNMVAKTDP